MNIKKTKIIKRHNYNNSLVKIFINKYPELASGRKNYLEKEIAITKDICLTKFFKDTKKINLKSIPKIKFIKKLKKISLIAHLK